MPKHPKDTAIRRDGPSAPLRWLLQGGHLPPPEGDHFYGRHAFTGGPIDDAPTVLDYGCGHGADVEHLRSLGYDADGWDKYWKHQAIRKDGYDVVLCTYVLNVIVDADERAEALRDMLSCVKPGGVAFVTVRRDLDGDTESQRLIRLDFPTLVDGTGFAIYRLDKPTEAS